METFFALATSSHIFNTEVTEKHLDRTGNNKSQRNGWKEEEITEGMARQDGNFLPMLPLVPGFLTAPAVRLKANDHDENSIHLLQKLRSNFTKKSYQNISGE